MSSKFIILEKKHINRKKSYVPDDITDFRFNAKPDDDTWLRFQPILGEKIISEEIFQVPDRAITFNRNKVEKLEDNYNNETKEFQDKFDNDIAALNPERTNKDQLDRMDYNKLKVTDVQKVLEKLQKERDLIKEKVEHFSNQINQAKVELTDKDKQIDGIKSEIALVETFENSAQSEIENGKDVAEVLQKELKSLTPQNESEKIFGAINSLVVLLNSKNQTTLNELNAVK